MAQFTVYMSNDSEAPALTGTTGSLLDLLNKCLVEGYGSKSPAGWTKPYEDYQVNFIKVKGCFLPGAGTQMGVCVNDNADWASATGKEARVWGQETLTDYNDGTNKFPTGTNKQTGYVYCRKSTTADTTSRTWICFADNRTCYLFIRSGDYTNAYTALVFGDIYSINRMPDAYSFILIGKYDDESGTYGNANEVWPRFDWTSATCNAHWLARSYTQNGSSIACGKTGDGNKGYTNYFGTYSSTYVQYPNGADNAIYINPIWIHEGTDSIIRGRLRGVYSICHQPVNFSDGDIFSGTGDYSGKSFIVLKNGAGPDGNYANTIWAMETSNTLETN